MRGMDAVDQIFGAALGAGERKAEAPQGPEAVSSPSSAAIAEAEAPGASAEPAAQPEPMCRLAQLVVEAMRRNVAFRATSGVTERLQYALDANTNHFSDEQLAALSTILPPSVAKRMFTSLTFTKTRGAKSRFVDVVNNSREPLFEVSASPFPDVPEDVDAEVLRSMMRDINAVFAALARLRGDEPLSPEEEAALAEVVRSAAVSRKDEVYARRKEYADVRARRMQEKIWDVFVEGGGEKALSDCISATCLYGTGFVVGPVPRVVAANKCVKQKNGTLRYLRTFKLKPVFESPNPMDCYPAPDAREPSDGPFCIRERYTAEALWRFAGGGAARERNGEGWNERAVRDLLAKHPNGGVKFHVEPEDARKQNAEMNKGAGTSEDCTFEAVRCFLSVRGSELAEIGIVRNRDGKNIVLGDFHHVEAIVIDGLVVYCRILDARFDVPVSKAVFYELPGSFWGESIADKLVFAQMMQNNTGKALFLDLAATGPMLWVNNAQRLLDKGATATQWSPYKTIAFGDELYSPSGSAGAPVGVLDVPTKAVQLLREWEEWQTQADIDSGIPRFAEGQTSGAIGALRTSGGLAQMTEHMMIVVKMVAMQFDDGVVKTVSRRIADWVLVYDDDMDLKGDVYIRPVGMFGRMLREQLNQARLQFFNVIAANPNLVQLFGPKALVALARPIVRGLGVNGEEFLPSEERARWLEEMNNVAAAASAERQAAGGAEGGGADAGGGAPQGVAPGVAPVENPAPPGGVAERRAVA